MNWDSPKEFCEDMFLYFDELTDTASELVRLKLESVINVVDKNSKPKIKAYCDELPIIGFNSNLYDINLLTNDGFIEEILNWDEKQFVIKDGIYRYKVIKTETLMFLDQMMFCAPGTSLSSFINAYRGMEEKKGNFPYELFDSYYDKLNFLVANLWRQDFYSSLKK